MKRIISLMLCIALIATPICPHAAETAAAEEIAIENQKTASLHIDNTNTYEGMEKPYNKGYTPTISDHTVLLILPLEPDGELKDHQITASIDLGSVESTPFIYKNYQKNFSLEEKEINGTEDTKSIYYVRFDLALSEDRYNGIYPVSVKITGKDLNGTNISQSFTLYISITDGKNQNDNSAEDNPSDSDDPLISEDTPDSADTTYMDNISGTADASDTGNSTPTSEPIVLVSAYSLNPGEIYAGENFSAAITLTNTNPSKSVQNMVVTIEYDNTIFTLLEDSQTIYIPNLGKGESMEIPLSMSANLNAPEGTYKISFSMSYDNADATTLSSAGAISIPLKQKLDIELTMPQIADSVNAGDTLPLNFQVMNLGRSKIYNIRCEISGDGLFPTSTAFIGSLEAGTEGSGSLNLFIGSKNQTEGYTGTEKYGETEGTVTLLYEDADGKQYTQEFSFTTTISKPEVVAITSDNAEETKPAGQWWLSVSIGVILILICAIIFTIRKMKKYELD